MSLDTDLRERYRLPIGATDFQVEGVRQSVVSFHRSQLRNGGTAAGELFGVPEVAERIFGYLAEKEEGVKDLDSVSQASPYLRDVIEASSVYHWKLIHDFSEDFAMLPMAQGEAYQLYRYIKHYIETGETCEGGEHARDLLAQWNGMRSEQTLEDLQTHCHSLGRWDQDNPERRAAFLGLERYFQHDSQRFGAVFTPSKSARRYERKCKLPGVGPLYKALRRNRHHERELSSAQLARFSLEGSPSSKIREMFIRGHLSEIKDPFQEIARLRPESVEGLGALLRPISGKDFESPYLCKAFMVVMHLGGLPALEKLYPISEDEQKRLSIWITIFLPHLLFSAAQTGSQDLVERILSWSGAIPVAGCGFLVPKPMREAISGQDGRVALAHRGMTASAWFEDSPLEPLMEGLRGALEGNSVELAEFFLKYEPPGISLVRFIESAMVSMANAGAEEALLWLIPQVSEKSFKARDPLQLGPWLDPELANYLDNSSEIGKAMGICAAEGLNRALQAFIETGADLDEVGPEGRAIDRAAFHGQLEALTMLIAAGVDSCKQSAGHVRFGCSHHSHWTPLHFAAAGGHVACVGELLAVGVPPEQRTVKKAHGGLFGSLRGVPTSYSAMDLAARNGHLAALKLLIQSGAADDEEQASIAMQHAIDGRHDNVIRYLWSRGITPDPAKKEDFAHYLRKYPGNKDLVAALYLHGAAARGEWKTLYQLIQFHGVDPHARDAHGRTALHRAAERGCSECIRVLEVVGLDRFQKDFHGVTPMDDAP